MANQLYPKGRNKFALGEIHWKLVAGDTIKVSLVDIADYTFDVAHEFVDPSLPVAARVATIAMTLIDPVDGVCDAQDVTFPTVTGDQCEALVLWKDTGDEGTSPLIAYITDATGLPVTPNGGDIDITWDNTANKIFKL